MKKTLIIAMLLIQGILVSDLFAQESSATDTSSVLLSEQPHQRIGFGIGFKGCTFGPGGEIIVAITPKFHVRVGGSYFKYSLPESFQLSEDIDLTDRLVLGGINLQANYYIAQRIYVTGGAFYNMFETYLEGTPKEPIMIGDIEATPEQVGVLQYTMQPGLKISPYAGIGFGRSLARNGIVSFAFEMGAVYHGAPDITLNATGMLTPTASDEQEAQMEENFSFFTIFPMVNVQLSIRIL